MDSRDRDVSVVAAANGHASGSGLGHDDLRLSDCAVFFDFDNTVTQFDVIDKILERFSSNRDWVALENAWQAGRIGSKACLEGQLHSVKVTKETLAAYLSTVPIDPSFGQLVTLCRKHGVEPVIVSDSFSFFINEILKHQKVTGLTVYANEMRFFGNRLLPSFPYANGCPRCAHCKKPHLLNARATGKTVIYIGDGLSDVCPSQHADLVFAKGSLLDCCREMRIPCVAFTDLGDVYDYLRRPAE